MKGNRGFTLVEILLAISLVAIVALALYGTFNSGLQVMSLTSRTTEEEDLNIFFEKLSRDLQNAFHYANIPFQGQGDRLSFATTIQTDARLGGDRGIGRVTYAYDPSERAILRTQEDINQIFEEETDAAQNVLSPLSSFRLEYYRYDVLKNSYEWKEEWEEAEEKTLPLAVKVGFRLQEEKGEKDVTRIISIPVGG